MGGHDIWRASLVSEHTMRERERAYARQQMLREAKAARTPQITEVTWLGGIKATAEFLRDAAREAFQQRRMSGAQGS